MNTKVLVAGLIVVLPLLGVLLMNLGRDPHAIESPLIGRTAPPFVLRPAGGGKEVSLASLRGRPVVVNFWATFCVPCLEEHAVLARAAQDFAPKAQFLGVVYEDEEDVVLRFLKEKGQAYPSLMDPQGKTAIAFGVGGVPETYFIDAGGSVVAKYSGPLDARLIAAFLKKAQGAS
jgi:cytochrome c biogenesis protein CcmG, thiol:disulfide interchange protein DsbE